MNFGLERLIATALSVAVRVGTMMTFGPFFGSQAIPLGIKAGLTVALTIVLIPVCRPPAYVAGEFSWGWLVLGEIMVGLALALSAQMVFEGAQFAGQLLGIQLGYSLVTVLDPQTAADSPLLSTLNQLIVLMLLLRLNVHHWLLRALVKTFEVVPPGTIRLSLGTVRQLVQSAGSLFVIGVQIATPILASTLVIDVALGLIGRVAPQIPVLFLGISVKSVTGLVILAGVVGLWPKLFERYFVDAMHASERLIYLLR